MAAMEARLVISGLTWKRHDHEVCATASQTHALCLFGAHRKTLGAWLCVPAQKCAMVINDLATVSRHGGGMTSDVQACRRPA